MHCARVVAPSSVQRVEQSANLRDLQTACSPNDSEGRPEGGSLNPFFFFFFTL